MEMITSILGWMHEFLISSGVAESINNFIREFFKAMGDMEEIIILSSFFLIIFIRLLKPLLVMMFIFALIKFGLLVVN